MSKAAGVQEMFDTIASRYDLMNRVMTFGQDQKWRRFVVDKAMVGEDGRVLDLATGTGDIAALHADTWPQARIVAGDFAKNMLGLAKSRFAGRNIHWLGCDANILPFADNSFDAVSFGYLLRNVDNPGIVLDECFRVLDRGGRVVCLDTTPPKKNLLYPFIKCYLRFGIPLLGRFIARDEAAYAYLTGSTMGFYEAEALAEEFTAAGFIDVGFKKFMMGTIGIHWGEKP